MKNIPLCLVCAVVMISCSGTVEETPCNEGYREVGIVWDDEKLMHMPVYEAIEDAPSIVGGLDAVSKHLVYPKMAIRLDIEGTVKITAYVNTSGEVFRTEVVDSLGFGCTEAAEAAVRMVKFIPGCSGGKPVNTRVTIPIRFRLVDGADSLEVSEEKE